MASRGHSAKKKKDIVNSQTREESKDPKVDEAMDCQANIIRNERLKSRLLGLHCSPTLAPNKSLKHTCHQLRRSSPCRQ